MSELEEIKRAMRRKCVGLRKLEAMVTWQKTVGVPHGLCAVMWSEGICMCRADFRSFQSCFECFDSVLKWKSAPPGQEKNSVFPLVSTTASAALLSSPSNLSFSASPYSIEK